MAANQPTKKLKLTLALDWRLVSVVLAAVIVGMLIIWRPWLDHGNQKTISVSGEALIEKEPDEYRFYPTFTAPGDSTTAATAAVSQTGNQVVAKLKELGVVESDIKTDVYSSEDIDFSKPAAEQQASKTYRATFTITARVHDKAIAQKVTDYLASTDAQGTITPTATFSEDLRKQIDLQAREQATGDARTKAEAQAKQLGVKVGKVISVEETQGLSDIIPLESSVASDSKGRSSPVIYPGTQELRVSLTVVFEIK